MNIYYIYFYLRIDGTPYYIGKGKGDRAFNKRRRLVGVPSKDRILFPLINLTEEQAFSNEKEFIAWYGRKDIGTGILRNFTDGGEGSSGRIVTEETREKIREKSRKQIRQKGRIISEEDRRKISLNHSDVSGPNNPMYGKKHTEESKQKMSNSQKGKPAPNKGKKMSEKQKQKFAPLGPRPVFACPHCSVKANIGNIKRWHFSNCKSLSST